MLSSKDICDYQNSTQTSNQSSWSQRIRTGGRAAALSVAFLVSGLGSIGAWAEQTLVNINLDNPEVLSEGLTGVGLAKAYRIVEYREAHGPFEAVEELAEVKGIGISTVEKNREKIVLE